MSSVILLAADHPMPSYDPGLQRASVSGGCTVTAPGFSIQPHVYYRDSVAALDLDMKPYRCELDVAATEEEAALLRTYLESNGSQGEQVELWHLWLGDDRSTHISRFHGPLSSLDQETLDQLCNPAPKNGCPGQCRITVTI